ncbi:MAG: hypothetical protein H6511_09240 [Holophagales bacterium]|nr:hypothetical protein [Holophagales bacterium]
MNRRDEKLLIRHLAGETSPGEARDLEARLGREPELAAAYGRLRTVWGGLELPPAPGAPAGFSARVRRRLEGAAPATGWLGPAPVWARVAAAAALVAGVALGAGLGTLGALTPVATASTEVSGDASSLAAELAGDSLADVYLDALASSTAASEGASQ